MPSPKPRSWGSSRRWGSSRCWGSSRRSGSGRRGPASPESGFVEVVFARSAGRLAAAGSQAAWRRSSSRLVGLEDDPLEVAAVFAVDWGGRCRRGVGPPRGVALTRARGPAARRNRLQKCARRWFLPLHFGQRSVSFAARHGHERPLRTSDDLDVADDEALSSVMVQKALSLSSRSPASLMRTSVTSMVPPYPARAGNAAPVLPGLRGGHCRSAAKASNGEHLADAQRGAGFRRSVPSHRAGTGRRGPTRCRSMATRRRGQPVPGAPSEREARAATRKPPPQGG